ncbi:hypothetical protein PV08_05017 [Exophiala spinifera]|uniref:Zn(2)-C6 fungal-type domain-containing protein n=1 Tax=Exophiala spinifera TaxID=91928 RepID=A0A0D1ZYS8_9EURO|nr:uncharacterized protein PV08_05017 [Exophiala spinifera]KIW17822.1 hypothetical protein PV08_05017 [Exophiala spinifera]
MGCRRRNRKKKCDEARPECLRCKTLGLRCEWPTAGDLVDRRCASTRTRRSVSPQEHLEPKTAGLEVTSAHRALLDPRISLFSASTTHQVLKQDLKPVISRHFMDIYYGLLILPNCHPEYYWGWIKEIQELMVQHESLQYSVLANAASHIHFIDDSSTMQELALTYYSQALRGLSELLVKASQVENHNGLLMTVMLLYLHGCLGRGTYTDIPRHVDAAIRILTLRLLESPKGISRPFDRLAVESVLYQIFLATTGSWSNPTEIEDRFDTKFWTQAEQLLSRSTLFPDRSISYNSPVLGIPFALFKLALSIKTLYQNPVGPDTQTLEEYKAELEYWECALLCDRDVDAIGGDEEPNCAPQIYKDAAFLYILNASMLLEQLMQGHHAPGPPRAHDVESWQVGKAREILKLHRNDGHWARCYIGNWPIYTLGFFMSTPEDIDLVRNELRRRWNCMQFGQIGRFATDLENTWAKRGYGN